MTACAIRPGDEANRYGRSRECVAPLEGEEPFFLGGGDADALLHSVLAFAFSLKQLRRS